MTVDWERESHRKNARISLRSAMRFMSVYDSCRCDDKLDVRDAYRIATRVAPFENAPEHLRFRYMRAARLISICRESRFREMERCAIMVREAR